MTETLRLLVRQTDGELSHLAARLETPPGPGRAPFTVLYLHGFASDQSGDKAAFFRRRSVERGIPFCSFDFQGHGASGGTMDGLTLSRNLADTRRLHRELARRGHRRVLLLGSSMGALTGLWYSAIYPAEVAAGLYLAPALGLDRSFAKRVGETGMREWERDGQRRIEHELGTFTLGWDLIADVRSYETGRLAETLRTPTLLLQGRLDDRVAWREVADFAGRARAEAVDFHLFGDGDHRLADRKERLWALMADFLEGHGLLAGP